MVMSGLPSHPQMEVVPESIIAVHWLVAYGDGMDTFVIVAAASTHAVSKVSRVYLVLIFFLSTVVLVSHCWL